MASGGILVKKNIFVERNYEFMTKNSLSFRIPNIGVIITKKNLPNWNVDKL